MSAGRGGGGGDRKGRVRNRADTRRHRSLSPGSRRCPDSSALGVQTEAAVVEMKRTSVRLPPNRNGVVVQGLRGRQRVLAGSWGLQLPHTLHRLQASKFTKKNPGVSERALLVHT